MFFFLTTFVPHVIFGIPKLAEGACWKPRDSREMGIVVYVIMYDTCTRIRTRMCMCDVYVYIYLHKYVDDPSPSNSHHPHCDSLSRGSPWID